MTAAPWGRCVAREGVERHTRQNRRENWKKSGRCASLRSVEGVIMKIGLFAVAFAAITSSATQSALAQTTGTTAKEALPQCVVMRTTGADRLLTAQWMFAAMARSPQIADLAAVTDQRKVELDKAFAKLLTRIIMKECLAQVRPLAGKDLKGAFEAVGRALGEVAMQELLGNDKVDKAIGAYTDYLAEGDFKPLIDSIARN